MNSKIKEIIAVGFLLLLSFLSFTSFSEESYALTPRPPVYIDGDGDFTVANGVVSGTGAPSDPFVIEGWEIDASTSNGIEIRNTNAHFVVRNSSISMGLNWYDGIHFYNVDNGRVENCTLSENNDGIAFYESSRIFISDSKIHSSFHQAIYVDGSDNYVIKNNTIFSDNNFGFWLRNSHNITVEGNNIYIYQSVMINDSYNVLVVGNNLATDIYGGAGVQLTQSQRIVVTANYLSNFINGVLTSTASGVLIQWNDFVDVWQCIQLSPGTDVTIVNNNMSGYRVGVVLSNSGDVLVANNDIAGGQDGISAHHNYGNITIADNDLSRNSLLGVEIWESTGFTILNNTFSNDGVVIWGYELRHYNSHTITTDNLVNGLPVYYHKNCNSLVIDGIPVGQLIVANCTNVLASNLTISKTDIGIQMGFVDLVVVNNSDVSSYNDHGIVFHHSSNITISENTVTNNNHSGIHLWRVSDSDIIHNDISNITDNNVMVRESHNGTISYNNVLFGQNYGIRLYMSDGFIVHHNNIVENAIQAIDDSPIGSVWDDGYPSGGNYWSDYLGNDSMGGPNQDIPGSDGIGDTPHQFDVDSQDGYPLMSPLPAKVIRPPSLVRTTLSGDGVENVTLSWSLSPDDGMGFNSVTNYTILRNLTFDSLGRGYQLVATVPNGTSEFVDYGSGEGDPNNYFYIVCAINETGNSSCSSNQAGKYTRPLSKGPNLISVPLIQSDESTQTVLQTVVYDNAWSHDPVSQEWRSFSISKPYAQSLEYLNHTMGIWVNVTQDSNLTVAGIVPTSTTINLNAGWNLIGFPSFDDSYLVTDLKATIALGRIEEFDGASPPYFLRAMVDSDILKAGYGYWIRVESSTVWTIECT